MNNLDLYAILRRHAGHNVRLYTRPDTSVALECTTCRLVTMSADAPNDARPNPARAALERHVSGSIARGEAEPIVAIDEPRGSTRDQMFERLGRIERELETLSGEAERLGFHLELKHELHQLSRNVGYAKADLVYLEGV